MKSVQDYKNNPNPISFSEFKRLINGIDEKRYGKSWVYVGPDNQCPVVDFSATTGLPSIALGAATAQLYRVYGSGPTATHVHFINARKQGTVTKRHRDETEFPGVA